MPELPEVETVCRELRAELKASLRVRKVELRRRNLRVPVPANLVSVLEGQAITAVRRRAKYILFDTAKNTIISHLGMSGSWRLEKPGPANPLKHDHCDIIFEDGQRLVFHDPRRFGLIDCVKLGEEHTSKWLKSLGPEPLEAAFSAAHLAGLASGKTVAVKSFIMDQKIVVGVGNIYASEALHRAGIRPQRRTGRVTKAEWQTLVKSIREILKRAIRAGGSTIRDYRQASGAEGSFQQRFQVYDREKELCLKCHEPIRAQVITGRSTYWCPQCQK